MMWLLACAGSDAWTDVERARIASLSPIPAPDPRPSNRFADDPAAAALGRSLFFDPGLSADGTMACATCHLPGRHFTEDARVHAGGTRNVPTIETAAWGAWYFWDGRTDSPWAQATGPIRNPVEMNNTAAAVRDHVATLAAFGEVFGPLSDDPDVVLAQVGKALEAFERTMGPGEARFDRWVATGEGFTAQEERGARLFVGEAGCVNCHHGPLFEDDHFHNLGLPGMIAAGVDPGRAAGAPAVLVDPYNCGGPFSDTTACDELRYLDPTFPDWAAAFKTPSLRNVADTAPYMHDGSMDSLTAVLRFYDALPGQPLVGHRELTLVPLRLPESDLAALEAFLRTLSATPA